MCATQWRQGFSGRTGLDYTACQGLLKEYLPGWQDDECAAGVDGVFTNLTIADLMADMQIIEHAMLKTDDERRERERTTRREPRQ